MTEHLWLLGDEFLLKNRREYPDLRASSTQPDTISAPPFSGPFVPEVFTMSMVFANHDHNRAKSAIDRMVNSFINKLNGNDSTCPKWIVIIPETDIMNSIQYSNFGVTTAYGMLIQYMMTQFDSAITKYFSNLGTDTKSVNQYNWPFFAWVEPVLHMDLSNNHLRLKFIRSMYNAAQMHDKVVILNPKQGWSYFQQNLIFNNNLSQKGVQQLFQAIDNSIRFADTKLMRNFGLKFTQIFQKDKLQAEAENRLASFELQWNRARENRKRSFDRGPHSSTRQPSFGLIPSSSSSHHMRQTHNTENDTSRTDNTSKATGIVHPSRRPLQDVQNRDPRQQGQPCCRKKLFFKNKNHYH